MERKKKIIIIVLFILLLSQIILFGLNSASNTKGKIISVALSSDQNSKEETIKKIWIGNFLIIEGKTAVTCEPINPVMKIKGDIIMIDTSYTGHYIECWGHSSYSAKYVIMYNNIFSALEAYIFSDAINIDFNDVAIF